MIDLTLSILGPLQVQLDDQPLKTFPSNKVQALLIYLVVEDAMAEETTVVTPHDRKTLRKLLWPNLPSYSGEANLDQAVQQLNRVIPETTGAGEEVQFLVSEERLIQIHPAVKVRLDVAVFEQRLRAHQSHEHTEPLGCQRCQQWLEEAAALYRGDFLADFSLPENEHFEAWAWDQRDRLCRLALDALAMLTSMHMEQGSYSLAQATAKRQLEIDPLFESAHRQLMEVLAFSGQPEAALSQYELCRRLLQGGLGMEPTAQTTAVYERIKAGSIS